MKHGKTLNSTTIAKPGSLMGFDIFRMKTKLPRITIMGDFDFDLL